MGGLLDDDREFVAILPLPFRALALAGLGILAWATNLHGLAAANIDPVSTLDLASSDAYTRTGQYSPILPASPGPNPRFLSHRSPPSTYYLPLYHLFGAYALWVGGAWCAFWFATGGDGALVDSYRHIPPLCALGVLVALFCPLDILHRRERRVFLRTFRRCLISPSSQTVYFSDVIFADIFTSFAKVIGDVWLSLYTLLMGGSLLVSPPQSGLVWWMVPTLMSIPYAVRLRQCMNEFVAPFNESTRPLYNAFKYASAFPVIFLSAAQRIVVHDLVAEHGKQVEEEAWHGEHWAFRLWLLSVAVNTLYSYWWDVTNDWGLGLLRVPSQSPSSRSHHPLPRPAHQRPPSISSSLSRPTPGASTRHTAAPMTGDEKLAANTNTRYPGLRSTLLLPPPLYPLAIILNLVLRLTWSLKLSTHLHSHADTAWFIFMIEAAELARRWMWVFFRVEWEVVRKNEADGGIPGARGSGSVEVVEAIEMQETNGS